jgi:hypothetical protein
MRMGNKALKRSFWIQQAGSAPTPCRTCSHFVEWIEQRDKRVVRCAFAKLCLEPDEGCEKWQREPGSDDE